MHTSDPTFAVLHAVRLRGVARDEWLESILAGTTDGSVQDQLASLRDEGLLRQLTGRMQGWTLTKDGRARHAELLERDKQDGELVERLRSPYEKFLQVNQPFIDLCSAWQVRRDTGEPNDHSDESYDSKLFDELEDIHAVGDEVGAEVAGIADRFGSYRPRLEHAIEQVRAGDTDWFTKPLIDSYHTVWFELHEDLLVSQGIARESEKQG